MGKKTRLIIIVTVLVILLGGLFFWKFFPKNEASEITSVVATPSSTNNTATFPKIENYQIPILMYHYIRIADENDELGKNLSVTPANFEDQLKWLKENNYETLKISNLADPEKKVLSKIIGEGKNPIVLTFDDGYEDAYTNALPIMQKYGFVGVFYIIRNSVGKPEYMNQTQIAKMAEAGMEIGSHTLSHPNLTSLDADAAQKQIVDSKETASAFCYPAGKFNDTVVDLVKNAGYTTATTTQSGVANQDSNLFELPRIRMQDFSGTTLGKKLNGN